MRTDISALTAQVSAALNSAREAKTSTEYDLLAHRITDLGAAARELMQASLSNQYLGVVRKLESNQPLDDDELKLIELIIVGEAEGFLRHERDIAQWQDELETLIAKAEAVESAGLDSVEQLMRVRALCRDSGDVANRIALFYREKERVDSFRQSTTGPLTTEARTTLADVIRAMMASDKM
jgi:hypothetical protein